MEELVKNARFCLRGEIEGELRTWPLLPGTRLVGSSPECAVLLTARGVSRRHGKLVVTDGALSIEDLGSVNGTFHQGRRIERTELRPGDEVRFGPVRLRVDLVPAADAELGLAFELSRGAESALSHVTSLFPTELARGASADLVLIDAVLDRLTVVPDADLAGALGLIATAHGAHGAAFVQWARSGPAAVIASSGTFGAVPAGAEIRPHLGEVGEVAWRPGEESAGAWGPLLPGEPREPVGLLLWGGGPVPEELPLVTTLLRLIVALHRSPVAGLTDEARPTGPADLVAPSGIVLGESPAMVSLYQQIRSLVRGDTPVLVLGETGVGKEHVARMLHLSSDRASKPFLAVNCAAIPANLLEAEMFGIAKGVATGVEARPGAFVAAEGGCLFLDEIGEMPFELQAKLLRALQEREVTPVGSTPRSVDVRVIAASNRDLARRAEEGVFRADLYYRLAGYELEVPPLRQRREDLPRLLGLFLQRFARQHGKKVRGVTVQALRVLSEHRWPGNVRELEHEMRRVVHLCPSGQAVDSQMLSPRLHGQAETASEPGSAAELESGGLEAQVEALERRLIHQALRRTAGNQTRAAKLLRVSRSGFLKRLKRLGIKSGDYLP